MFLNQMHVPSLLEIEKIKKNFLGYKTKNISILRNITIEGIEPYLSYVLGSEGHLANVRFGGYDSILQDATNSSEILFEETDFVIIFSFLQTLSPLLSDNYASLSKTEIEGEIQRIGIFIQQVLRSIREKTSAQILWYGFESPVFPAFGIADSCLNGQSTAVENLNQNLREFLSTVPSAFYINANLHLSRLGVNQYYDLRYWHIAKSPYSKAALIEIAYECMKYIRSSSGNQSKCLALDCDNTLWGGILGEDGINGIKIGNDPSGSPFRDFQLEILSLHKRGVILTICSKNNEQDVLDLLDNHPDMLLKTHHFAAWKINWSPKSENLKALAADLNIGVDSFVFVDDSHFEVDLVKSLLPNIKTIHLPIDKPSCYRWLLASSGFFDKTQLTDEDSKRTELYQAEQKRQKLLKADNNLDNYYRTLELELEIIGLDNYNISRIAQQTQKTNQFNLTTRRYTEADLDKIMQTGKADIYCLRVKDKFGDMGIIGSVVLKHKAHESIIDALLLSCRALGREIENYFLQEILHILSDKNFCSVYGQYIKSPKNSQAKHFFALNHFDNCPSLSSEGEWYKINLSKLRPRSLGHFQKITSPLGSLMLG